MSWPRPAAVLLVALLTLSCDTPEPAPAPLDGWAHWGADLASSRYAALGEIDASNFRRVSVAWSWQSVDVRWLRDVYPRVRGNRRAGAPVITNFQLTPVYGDGALFEAKAWLKALLGEAEDAASEALTRLEQVLPKHSDPPVLREVQQALAREQGFASWADLKEHAKGRAERADLGSLSDIFLEHACIFTRVPDLPPKLRRAERILARHPEIAQRSIHTAILCGEVDQVGKLLAREASVLTQPGGPQQWEPLLFACYGRIERGKERGLEMVRLLLDGGADPNTHFVSPDDWRLRFNALTGVMGQGEMGRSEHPQADAVARLLLERGANPNDSQGLYNTCLVGDDTRWLELLLAHGLGPESPVAWHAHPEDRAKSGTDESSTMLDFLAGVAARWGHTKRLTLLIEHGANPDARNHYDGRTCYEHARMTANSEAAEILVRHGATAKMLAGHDAFVAAVRGGDRAAAAALVEESPAFKQNPEPLLDAASRADVETVRLLLELGVDPNVPGQHGHRALHNGVGCQPIAELLLEYGADPRARVFGGTACGWARHAGDGEMARLFAERGRSLLDAVASGHVALVRELLTEAPGCLDERNPAGNGPLHELPADVDFAEPIVAMLLAKGADPDLENAAGETPPVRLEAMGADETADLLEVMRGA